MYLKYNILVIILLFISFTIWDSWQTNKNYLITSQVIQKIYNESKKIESQINKNDIKNKNQIITIKTDKLLLKINKYGGDIKEAFLLSYNKKLNSTKPFHLLQTSPEFIYQAILKVKNKNFLEYGNILNPLYVSKKETYILKNNEKEISVPLIFNSNKGIKYIKTFVIKKGDFTVKIRYTINNNSKQPIKLSLCGELIQSTNLSNKDNISIFAIHPYRGAVYSSNNCKYKKYSFQDIRKKNLFIETEKGWIAMIQQYFATAWILPNHVKNTLYSMYLNDNKAVIGFKSAPVSILPGSKDELQAKLWVGPEIQDKMINLAPNLDLTVNYGCLWFIAQPLFKMLKLINKYVHNWGFSIIIITLILRSIMYPLTKYQYISMAKLRIIKPKLTEIREKWENDRKRQHQEIISLYKKEKINPIGGFLPLIIQTPIFLALYYMLLYSIELRHSSFILWIHDLSAADPYYILPIIMGITMLTMQILSPSINDIKHQKFMIFMPLIYIIFFLWLPSGLVLYYIVSNLISIIQQKIIQISIEKTGLYFSNKINK